MTMEESFNDALNALDKDRKKCLGYTVLYGAIGVYALLHSFKAWGSANKAETCKELLSGMAEDPDDEEVN